ncbi:DUF4185 domain-containing protein [Nonomuraea jiangxiensis]|uniref:DUF4185 domain-containing protein n=1 Tax=Nonomuraea jiangxiensis TaxID=633440 RepID=A0A1G8XQN4_9ACTN|nr:DUF4185 domain-containing protein [Nonomuraea jiangxiensis]SDJ92773.1 hypothetical protein SAMN05421869_11345 [Nonomuraea jiangxiensis]
MPRFRSALASLAVLSLGIAAAPASAPARQCPAAVRGVTVDPRLTSLFTVHGNDNARVDDWTGGDGTYSLGLPGGRELWIFSDTFLGRVNADGTRPQATVMLNNSFAVERAGRLATVHGGTAKRPAALMPPRGRDHWFWAGDATLAGGIVEVTYQEYARRTHDLDWRWRRNVLARFAPGRLARPIGVHGLPSGRGVAWGSGILEDGGHTYVYGVEDLGSSKYMHLARVGGGSLLGRWEFRTAGGSWSADEADSARLMSGVANEYSVTRVGSGYVLITHDTSEPLSANIVAYSSCSPAGPFTGRQHVYTTPETRGNVFTYNAHAHPGVPGPGLVVSYNVNSLAHTDHYHDVSLYRPRFLNVRLAALPE